MNKQFIPEHLTKWQSEPNYGGEDLSEWYIVIAQTRDSFLLERNNFAEVKEYIKSEGFEIASNVEDCKNDNAFLLASFGHWACGWIESIMIHESNTKGLQLADEIKAKLDNYPIWDDESYSIAEMELIDSDIQEYYVKSYLDDCNLKCTDKSLDYITYELQNVYTFELNGYDEVLTSASDEEINETIDKLLDRFNHLTTCQTCHETIDNRFEVCSCQEKLF